MPDAHETPTPGGEARERPRPQRRAILAQVTIVSGKVIEIHGQFDQMGLMQQIGAAPAQ